MWTTVLAGFTFGLGLIVAIGAQNVFVLRQGLARSHVGMVVAVCIASDSALILLGTAGMGSLVTSHPTALAVATGLGALVLAAYGVMAAYRALRPTSGATSLGELTDAPRVTDAGPTPGRVAVAAGPTASRARTLLAVLGFTWLNPHVYLDTVVLLGATGSTYAQPWLFAAGAALGSVVWFGGLGYGARILAPAFSRPVAWRVFDGLVAVIMLAFAAHLASGLLP